MLVIGLIGALVLYAVLFLLYGVAEQTGFNVHTSLLMQIRQMIFEMPEAKPLAYLKLGIIVFAFYVITDGLFSSRPP